MSIEAREWAWGVSELLPSARLLLLALAEHVSDGATCFPGQSRLAAMCGISDRQVRSLLRELQARGLITVEHRPGEGRGRKSNVYRLELGNRQSASACPKDQAETDFRNPASGCQGATGTPGQDNRNSASVCPNGQPELQFRNSASDCPEATGSPAQGNRKSATGNRNPTSAETEEGNGRKEFIDTPPYPPSAGNAPGGEDGCEPGSLSSLDKRSSEAAGVGMVPRVLPRPAAAESRGQVTGSPVSGMGVNGSSAAATGFPKVVALESAAAGEGGGPGTESKQRKGPLTLQNAGPPSPGWGSGQRTRKTREKGNGTDRQSTAKDYTVGATSDEDLPDWASGWRDRNHVAE
jgi:hypothetical protein